MATQVLEANLSAANRGGGGNGGTGRRGVQGSLRRDTPKLLGDQGYALQQELDACVI